MTAIGRKYGVTTGFALANVHRVSNDVTNDLLRRENISLKRKVTILEKNLRKLDSIQRMRDQLDQEILKLSDTIKDAGLARYDFSWDYDDD